MKLKGQYKLVYTLDKEINELFLEVVLKPTEGLLKKGQNLWYGVATVNNKPYTKEDLSHCVDAQSAAKKIGRKLLSEIKVDAKKNGIVFRIKKEEII